MPPHIALRNTRTNLRPLGLGVAVVGDKYRVHSIRPTRSGRPVSISCACPEMAYVIGLKASSEIVQ